VAGGGVYGLLLPGLRSRLCGVEEIPVLELGIVHVLQQVGRCRSPATRPGPHNRVVCQQPPSWKSIFLLISFHKTAKYRH
jgi:hypothetical protein